MTMREHALRICADVLVTGAQPGWEARDQAIEALGEFGHADDPSDCTPLAVDAIQHEIAAQLGCEIWACPGTHRVHSMDYPEFHESEFVRLMAFADWVCANA